MCHAAEDRLVLDFIVRFDHPPLPQWAPKPLQRRLIHLLPPHRREELLGPPWKPVRGQLPVRQHVSNSRIPHRPQRHFKRLHHTPHPNHMHLPHPQRQPRPLPHRRRIHIQPPLRRMRVTHKPIRRPHQRGRPLHHPERMLPPHPDLLILLRLLRPGPNMHMKPGTHPHPQPKPRHQLPHHRSNMLMRLGPIPQRRRRNLKIKRRIPLADTHPRRLADRPVLLDRPPAVRQDMICHDIHVAVPLRQRPAAAGEGLSVDAGAGDGEDGVLDEGGGP